MRAWYRRCALLHLIPAKFCILFLIMFLVRKLAKSGYRCAHDLTALGGGVRRLMLEPTLYMAQLYRGQTPAGFSLCTSVAVYLWLLVWPQLDAVLRKSCFIFGHALCF